MTNFFLFLGAFDLLTSCSSPRPSSSVTAKPSGGWQYLGDKWVNFDVDHDELMLGNIKDEFRLFRLRVLDGPLHLMEQSHRSRWGNAPST